METRIIALFNSKYDEYNLSNLSDKSENDIYELIRDIFYDIAEEIEEENPYLIETENDENERWYDEYFNILVCDWFGEIMGKKELNEKMKEYLEHNGGFYVFPDNVHVDLYYNEEVEDTTLISIELNEFDDVVVVSKSDAHDRTTDKFTAFDYLEMIGIMNAISNAEFVNN